MNELICPECKSYLIRGNQTHYCSNYFNESDPCRYTQHLDGEVRTYKSGTGLNSQIPLAEVCGIRGAKYYNKNGTIVQDEKSKKALDNYLDVVDRTGETGSGEFWN